MDANTEETVDGGTYLTLGHRRIWHYDGGDPAGNPVVLLHGAFASAATWGAQFADFGAAGLRVLAPERSGHGHSPDHVEPFSYLDMAAETIDYLEAVLDRPAHLVGWSDGAVVGLLVAMTRPELVGRMVLVGQYFNRSGAKADTWFDAVLARDPATIKMLRTYYDVASPDGPEHFDTVLDKTMALITAEPDLPLDQLAQVHNPTLVIQADNDVVELAHTIDVVNALPNGRLAVLPGTHILPLEAPEVFNPLILSYLAAEPPAKWP
ncbi:alpha/beta hydrolase [Gordonia sp. TBRC 11910]|uniref:Alpha/beta hydrolase n=1 Tax=Gordonia asplenii TaxID=2725283 RepID=A0A848L0A2_9ACTN|nr:alpha/beta hydrolase [Gordonia asplenii]NMO03867.1 alpha/beta hydrolase [Gordonia asplenii]